MKLSIAAPCERARYLRVVGADDRAEAQQTKLRVRDAALDRLAHCKCCGLLSARRLLLGVAPDARVSVCLWSPDGGAKIPTVQITLGAGAGRNWFGLLYPEMCGGSWRDQGAVFRWPIFDFLWSLFF